MNKVENFPKFFFFLAAPSDMQNSLHQGLNPHPLQWNCGVLITKLPGMPKVDDFSW